MKKLVVLFIIVATNCCTTTTPANDKPVSKGVTLKHLAWLTGTWKSVHNNEISFEVWNKQSDTLLEANSFTTVEQDTVFSETIRLVQRGPDIYYIPRVKDQNDGKPVLFRFMEFNKGEFNFVNTEHDFPQRIIYKNPQPDFLCARIEGNKNGKFMKVDFNFVKIK